MPYKSLELDAVRIIFLVYFCGKEEQQASFLNNIDDHFHTHILESEIKLQKFDFWLRYPDHFAAALLRASEPNRLLARCSSEIESVIQQIFADAEPFMRLIPMRKYLHGAYEQLDDVMAFLSSRILVDRRTTRKGQKTNYCLTRKGSKAVEGLLADCSESHWYADRCKLISRFFGTFSGEELARLQYLEPDYENTPLEDFIKPVEGQVRARFLERFGGSLP